MIALLGATGRSGEDLARVLLAEGVPFRPIARNLAAWEATGIPVPLAVADVGDAGALKAALAGATHVVSTAHARWTPMLLDAAEPDATFVLMGSTRRYSRWADAHGDNVRLGEAAFLASGRRGVMLHPTMIYGAAREQNVRRLAALLARLPVAPLPGGGRALVQPIHQSDVTRCLRAALRRDWDGPRTMVIAGPAPMPYRDFLRAVAAAAGLRAPPILSVPVGLLVRLLPLLRLFPGAPMVNPGEIRRLSEDKDFDIGPMRTELGVDPIPLDQGLALAFPAPHTSP